MYNTSKVSYTLIEVLLSSFLMAMILAVLLLSFSISSYLDTKINRESTRIFNSSLFYQKMANIFSKSTNIYIENEKIKVEFENREPSLIFSGIVDGEIYLEGTQLLLVTKKEELVSKKHLFEKVKDYSFCKKDKILQMKINQENFTFFLP